MPNENTGIKLKAIIKIEKYPDNVTQEEIDKGLVKPIEVVMFEDEFKI
jgi:hypothetical protein